MSRGAGPDAGPTGVLVVDKPGGLTSHQVVARARRALGTRKVGHAGTLDPMATGVLIIGAGRATRLLGHLMATAKVYTATIRLGSSTTTDDADGEVSAVIGAGGIDRTMIENAMAAYRGDIEQVPSAVSAIKVGGVRSYVRARSGEQVQLAARPVRIDRYDLLAVREADVDGVAQLDLDVEVACGSGTYIRALARDLGTDLGCGGHLTALRRTAVGAFTADEACALDDLAPERLIDPAAVARRTFPVLEVDTDAAIEVGFGRPLPVTIDRLTAVIGPDDRLLALYRPDGDRARPEVVFVG